MKNRILKIGTWCVFIAIMLITPMTNNIQAQSNTVGIKTAEDTAQLPNAGWLIFDGELIPGPYDIVIEDDCIKVNGRSYMAPPEPPKQTKEVPYDSNAVAVHNLLNRAEDTFYTYQSAAGLQVAQERTLASLRNEKLVDSAYFSGLGLWLMLHYPPEKEETIPFILMLAEQRPAPPQPYTERRREILEDRAQSLRGWLSNGNLVILRGVQGLYVINSMKARETLEKLRAIVASTPDMETRTAAIRKIIHDDRMAKAIAERLE